MSGLAVDCGSVDGKQKTFSTKDVQTQPHIALHGARLNGLYAAFLLNPLPPLGSIVSPILHTAAGNIPGSSLLNGSLSGAVIISKFFPPNPPIPLEDFQYIFLVFQQPSEIDWTDVSKLGTTRFPIEKVAADKNLTLVASNYFTAQKDL